MPIKLKEGFMDMKLRRSGQIMPEIGGKEPVAEINVMPKDHLHDIHDELLHEIWTHFDPAASNKFSNFSSNSQLNFVSCDASQFQEEYSCKYYLT